MDIIKVLSDYNCREGKFYPHEIDTPIGTLQLNYKGDMLFTNFVGYEEKAKLVQGHWKNNAYVLSEVDIVDHIESIFYDINKYKQILNG